MRTAQVCLALMGVLLVANCRNSSAPLSAVVSQIELGRSHVALNDTVTLRAIATNNGSESLQFFGGGCSGGLDIEARLPTGERQLLLRNRPNLCDMKDSNTLEPGETDTVAVIWRFTGPAGEYRLRAGVALASGLGAPSAFAPLTIE